MGKRQKQQQNVEKTLKAYRNFMLSDKRLDEFMWKLKYDDYQRNEELLKSKISELEKEKLVAEARYNALRDEVFARHKELADAGDKDSKNVECLKDVRFKVLRNENIKVHGLMVVKDFAIEKMTREKAALEKENKHMKAILEKYGSTVSLVEMERRCEHLELENSRMRELIAIKEVEAKTYTRVQEELMRVKIDLAAKLEEIQRQYGVLSTELDTYETWVQELEKTMSDKNVDITAVNFHPANVVEERSAFGSSADRLKRENESLKESMAVFNQWMKTIKSQLNKTGNNMKVAMKSLVQYHHNAFLMKMGDMDLE